MRRLVRQWGGVRRRWWRPLGRTSVLMLTTSLVCVLLLLIDNLPDTDLNQGASWDSIQGAIRPEAGDDSADDKPDNKPAGDGEEKDDDLLYKNEAALKPKKPHTWLEMVEEIRADWIIGGENVYGVTPPSVSPGEGERQPGEELRDVSRYGEPVLVDKLLQQRTGGFYMESGAGDGRTLSSTLFLEQNRGWTGVLLEPDKEAFKTLNEFSARKAARLQACLSPTGRAGHQSYVGDLEGFEVPGEMRLEDYIPWVTPQDSILNLPHEGYNVSVQCFPLPAVLLALRKLRVDFWVLDTGAAEVDILGTAMLDTFIYDVIAVNVWAESIEATLKKLEQVKEVFIGRGYHPVRILPKHWEKLQSAMVVVQRVPAVYPVMPQPPLHNPQHAATGANTSITNTTAPGEASLRPDLQQWLHWPKPRESRPDSLPKSSRSAPGRKGQKQSKTQPRSPTVQPQSPGVASLDRQFSGDAPAQTVLKHLSFRDDYYRLLRSLLPDAAPGFFLETQVSEGQLTSTTLHLERELNWTGVVLEPDPDLFLLLLGRRRRCAALNMCLSVGGGHQGGRRGYRRGTNLTPGGRMVQTPGETSCSRLKSASGENVACATCVQLSTLPAAFNRSTIDFISLQLDDLTAEGISQMDLQALGVRVISVEYPTSGKIPSRVQEGGRLPLLVMFEKRLAEQQYVQAGSVTDDRHLMTTALLYRRRDATSNDTTGT